MKETSYSRKFSDLFDEIVGEFHSASKDLHIDDEDLALLDRISNVKEAIYSDIN